MRRNADEELRHERRGLDRRDPVAVERFFFKALRSGDRASALAAREWAHRVWTGSDEAFPGVTKWINAWRRMNEALPTHETRGEPVEVLNNPDESLRDLERAAVTGGLAEIRRYWIALARLGEQRLVRGVPCLWCQEIGCVMLYPQYDSVSCHCCGTASTISGEGRPWKGWPQNVPLRPGRVENPDEDLRDLERRARRGDRAARARLQAERRRRGLPGGHLPESSRGLYRTARDLSRHAPDASPAEGWVNEDARIRVYETSSDFQIEDLDTGESRGMGDGVDMFHDRRDRSLWPGTREFNDAMANEVERGGAELREAYFGQ